MKRTVCAVDEGISAQEPDAKRSKVEDDEKESVLQLDMQDFECVICADLMVDPVVGRCGHDFCKGCLEDWLYRNKHKPHCPVCRTHLGSSQEEHGVCLRLKELVEKLYPRRSKDRRREVEKQTAELKQRRKQEEQQRRREQEQRRAAYAAAGGQGYGFHMSGWHIQEELRRMRSQLEGAYADPFREQERQAAARMSAWSPPEPGVAHSREVPAVPPERLMRTRRGTAAAAAAAAAARGSVRPGAGAAAGRGQARQVAGLTHARDAAHRDAGPATAAAGGTAGRSADERHGEQQGHGPHRDTVQQVLQHHMAIQAHADMTPDYLRQYGFYPHQLQQFYEEGMQHQQQVRQHEERFRQREQQMRRSSQPWQLAGSRLHSNRPYITPIADALATGTASHAARDATTQVDAVAAAPQAAAAAAAGVDSSRHDRAAGQSTAAAAAMEAAGTAAAGLEAVPSVTRLQADDFDAWGVDVDIPWGTLGVNESPAERGPQQPPGSNSLPAARPITSTAVAAAAAPPPAGPRGAPAARFPAEAAAAEPAVEQDYAALERSAQAAMDQLEATMPGSRAAAAPGSASDRLRHHSRAATPWQVNLPGVLPEHSSGTGDDAWLPPGPEVHWNPESQIRAPPLPSDAAVVAAATAGDDDADSGCRRPGDHTADSSRRRTAPHHPHLEVRLHRQAAAVAAAQARLRFRNNERAGLRRAALPAVAVTPRSRGTADLAAAGAAAGAEQADPATTVKAALVASAAADAEHTGADPAARGTTIGAIFARNTAAAAAAAAGADADRVGLASAWGATYPRSPRDWWMRGAQDDLFLPTSGPAAPNLPGSAGFVDMAAYLNTEREAQEVGREVAGAAGEPPAAAAGRSAAAGDRDRVHPPAGGLMFQGESPTAHASDSDESPAVPPTAAAATVDDMPGQQQQQGARNRAADDNIRRRGAFLDMMSSRPAAPSWFRSATGAVRAPSGAQKLRAQWLRTLSDNAAAGTAQETASPTTAAAATGDDGVSQRPRRMAYMIPTPQRYVDDPGVSELDPNDAEGSNRPAQALEAAETLLPAAAAAGGGGGGNPRNSAAGAAERQDILRAQSRLSRVRRRVANTGRQPQRAAGENQGRPANSVPSLSGGVVPPTAAAAGLAPAESAELAEEVARATARHVRREVEGLLTGNLSRRHAAPTASAAVVMDGGYISSSSEQ